MRQLALIVVGLSCVTVAATQPQSRGVRDLAVRLAANGVPGGCVVAKDDFTAVGRPPLKDPRGREAFRVDLPQVLAEFERKNPRFRAQSLPGWVLVGSKEQPAAVTALLSRAVSLPGLQRTTAGDAIFKHLAGKLRNTPITGLAGVGPMPRPSCPLNAAVTINTAPYIVTTFLNHVVEQVPGLVWVVTFDPSAPDAAIRLGVVCPDGSSFQMPLGDGQP